MVGRKARAQVHTECGSIITYHAEMNRGRRFIWVDERESSLPLLAAITAIGKLREIEINVCRTRNLAPCHSSQHQKKDVQPRLHSENILQAEGGGVNRYKDPGSGVISYLRTLLSGPA